jgi:hypothetical protein
MAQFIEIDGLVINLREILNVIDSVSSFDKDSNQAIYCLYDVNLLPFSFEEFLDVLNDLKSLKERGVTYSIGDNKVLRYFKDRYLETLKH